MEQNHDEVYVRPQKAYRKWNNAKIERRTVYIYGVSGSGKTTFVKNALSNKKYQYYSLCDGVPEEIKCYESKLTIVVFDDIYMMNEDDDRESFIQIVSELSERDNVWIIMINRAKVPSWLVPIFVKQIFNQIEEEDLLLDYKDIREYMNMWNISLTDEELESVCDFACGNGMTVRMCALELLGGGTCDEDAFNRIRVRLWDYLEHHVYDQWEIKLQEFLMQISIVESFTVRMSEVITGRSDVEYMLKCASEIGNFLITEGDTYTYVKAMKLSMRRRLRERCSKEQQKNLYYNAGLYFEMQRDNWNALLMYEQAGNNEKVYDVLIANTRENPASGQYYKFRKYYLNMPKEQLLKSPELMTGMSMLQSLLMNAEESEYWYSELEKYEKNESGSRKRLAQCKLLYLDIALPHRGSVQILDLLKRAWILLKERKNILPEFSVTSNLPSMMNGGKDFCEWSKKDNELANSVGKLVEFVLGKYGKGLVNLALAESYLEKGQDNYKVASLASRGKLQAEAGGKIEQCFNAVGTHCWLCVLSGHAEEAQELLDDFMIQLEQERKYAIIDNLKAFRVRMWLYKGATNEVSEWMNNEAPNEYKEFFIMDRLKYLTKVRVYIQQGMYQKALLLIEQMKYYAEINNRTYISMEVNLLMAIIWYRLGENRWEEALQKTVTKAEEYHFVRLLSREGAALKELLKSDKIIWNDDAYKHQVINETEQMAIWYPDYLKEKDITENSFSENAINILRLQAEGLTNKEIAIRLDMKFDNVKYHVKENYRKLGVSSKAAAVNEARNRKLLW